MSRGAVRGAAALSVGVRMLRPPDVPQPAVRGALLRQQPLVLPAQHRQRRRGLLPGVAGHRRHRCRRHRSRRALRRLQVIISLFIALVNYSPQKNPLINIEC
jgi:hypothetical protein